MQAQRHNQQVNIFGVKHLHHPVCMSCVIVTEKNEKKQQQKKKPVIDY